MDRKHTHLGIIQGVINRLSNNSFLLKGWTVVLASGLFALAAREKSPIFAYLAIFPCIIFWFLDGYFLWQERLYRALYNSVRLLEPGQIDYGMDTSSVKKKNSITWLQAVFSPTLTWFHGAVLVTAAIVTIILIGN